MKTKHLALAALIVTLFALTAFVGTPSAFAANCNPTTGAQLEAAVASGACPTITLINTVYYANNMTLKNNLTIVGASPGGSIIDGGGATGKGGTTGNDSIFYDYSYRFFLDTLTLRNGYTTFSGGAIYDDTRGDLIIHYVTFFNNFAGNRGGAIYDENYNSTTISYSTFTANSAQYGGAIYQDAGTLTVSTSTFNSNSATRDGGAVYFDGTRADFSGSRFNHNHADGEGGAMIIYAPTSIKTTDFSANTSNYDGGALYIETTSATPSQPQQPQHRQPRLASPQPHVKSLKPKTNAPAAAVPTVLVYEVTIANSTFVQNKAVDDYGGAIYQEGGNLKISNSTFSSNVAYYGGGAIFANDNNLYVQRSTFDHNQSLNSNGGAIDMYEDQTIITNSTFAYNSVPLDKDGGALYVEYADTTGTWLAFDTFAHDVAGFGGEIYSSGYVVHIKNSILAYGNVDNCENPTDLVSGGGNISSDNSCALAFTAQRDANGVNPLLGPLQNNGGNTKTMALTHTSHAVDNVRDCTDWFGHAVTIDQRGITRPQGPWCDSGAYELVK